MIWLAISGLLRFINYQVEFITNNYRTVIEILILWAGLYLLFRAFRSSRGANIFLGIGVTLLSLTIIAELLDLRVVEWIMTRVVALLAFGLIVIFQPELRSAFARIGSTRWFGLNLTKNEEFLDELIGTVEALSKKRHGALIALEQSVGLSDYMDTGVEVDAVFSKTLVECIFQPNTTLHDGGLFISKDRVVAAGCLFPVSQRELSDRSIGLRHRAGIGLSEETDAIAIIVSEETGKISIATDGNLKLGMTLQDFRSHLEELTGTINNPTEES